LQTFYEKLKFKLKKIKIEPIYVCFHKQGERTASYDYIFHSATARNKLTICIISQNATQIFYLVEELIVFPITAELWKQT